MSARTEAEQSTMKARDTAALGSGMIRMFEQTELPLFELPAMRELLEDTAADCAMALRDISGLELFDQPQES